MAVKALFALFLGLAFHVSLQAVTIPLGEGAVGGKKSTAVGYLDIEQIFAEHPMTKRLRDEFQAEVEKRKREILDLDKGVADLQRVVISTTTEVAQAKADVEVLKTKLAIQQKALRETPAVTPQEPVASSTAPASAMQGTAISTAASVAPSVQQPGPVAELTAAIETKELEIREKEASLEKVKRELEQRREEGMQRSRQHREELLKLEERQTASVLADLYQLLEKISTEENLTIIIDKDNVLYGQAAQDVTGLVRERLRGR